MANLTIVMHAIKLQKTEGTFQAALWLKLFRFEVEEAVEILAKNRQANGGWRNDRNTH